MKLSVIVGRTHFLIVCLVVIVLGCALLYSIGESTKVVIVWTARVTTLTMTWVVIAMWWKAWKEPTIVQLYSTSYTMKKYQCLKD